MECDVKIGDASPDADADASVPSPRGRGGKDRIAAARRRPVTLVGLMGVGKTSIGKRLAARLGLDFVDADAEIELACGMTVAEIFERFGEAHFRDGERRVIARLIDGAPKVLATGGGAFMQDDTRALILGRSIAVWINADLQTLVERVSKRSTRPLLKGKDPGEVLHALATVRNPVYALAPIHVCSSDGPHNDAVEAIINALAAEDGQ
ncbi:shikimate kinase [Polymorphobacter sp.]|uniref:shikimate kinase n=1 Tax=Polymorphobacter sp. TaxID=1909290 RepID=UPI003F72A87D